MSVYTHISLNQLTKLLACYPPLGTLLDYTGINEGIENTNYFVDTSAGKFVLTIFEQHHFDELPFFLNLMAFIAEAGLPVPHPLLGNDAKYLQAFNGKPATLITCLQGQTVVRPSSQQCHELGATLAKMHIAMHGFNETRENNRDIQWCYEIAKQIHSRLTSADRALLEEELHYQNTHPLENIPSGIIHADLFCDNALFKDEKLTGIIDFYYACQGTFLYDLAVTINAWSTHADGSIDVERYTAMMDAYQQQRPLVLEETEQWRTALRLASLRFWLSRLYDKFFPRPGHLTHIKDPDAMKAILQYHLKKKTTIHV